MLYGTRAFSSIMLDVPAKERKLIAVDETELKVNGDKCMFGLQLIKLLAFSCKGNKREERFRCDAFLERSIKEVH